MGRGYKFVIKIQNKRMILDTKANEWPNILYTKFYPQGIHASGNVKNKNGRQRGDSSSKAAPLCDFAYSRWLHAQSVPLASL